MVIDAIKANYSLGVAFGGFSIEMHRFSCAHEKCLDEWSSDHARLRIR
jgi:hypothetical protein